MTYIIAEIGQNHNGDTATARQLITAASNAGADAVKFTIRDLEAEMSPEFGIKRYTSEHSYGCTYANHRKALELPQEELYELKAFARARGLDFVLTICQYTLVPDFEWLCDKIKVASRDIDNIPLLEALSKTNKEVILSTGMAIDVSEITRAVKILNGKTSILYCVSNYPTELDMLSLDYIMYYKKHFHKRIHKVGFSDHTLGTFVAPIAVARGAEIIEKHITLDKSAKGTDHKVSADPEEFKKLVSDIRKADSLLKGNVFKKVVIDSKYKLGRSVAYKHDMKVTSIVTKSDVHMVSPGNGFKWGQLNKILGHTLSRDVEKNEIIKKGDFYE